MTAPVVLRLESRAPFERGPGIRTTHVVTQAIGSTELLNGITEFAPKASIPLHTHNCEESVFVVHGTAEFESEGTIHVLRPGDCTWTPSGVPHRFRNAGRGTLRILWTYGLVTATRTSSANGVTSRISDEAPAVHLGNQATAARR